MAKKTFFAFRCPVWEGGEGDVYDLGRTMPGGIRVLLDVKGEGIAQEAGIAKIRKAFKAQ